MLAALVVLKLYLWPLGLWLLVTRRFRASLVGAGVAAVVTFGGWAAIGFAGFREYPHLLDRLTKLVAAESYSPYAFARSLGASDGSARLVMLGLGALVLAAVVERGRRPARDSAAFVLAIAVSLVLTPIVWPHYLILGFVAVALARPRFGVPWVVPAIIGAVLPGWSHGHAFSDRARPGGLRWVVRLGGLATVPVRSCYVRSASRTSSACVAGFTFRSTFLTVPSSATTNVERSTPKYFLPAKLFSPQTPYSSATR